MSAIKGFSSTDRNQIPRKENFATIHEIGSKKAALDVLPKAVFVVASDAVEAGVTDYQIPATGHSARVGDTIRFTSGVNQSIEAPVLSIEANLITLAIKLDTAPSIADTFDICRHITLTLNSSGALSVTPGPMEFIRNSSTEQVEEDTAVSANNRALPTKLFILKDGTQEPVTKDTATPANTVAVPVEIVGASGTTINITAGDINVQTSHLGASHDSMRIGDGTTLLDVVSEGDSGAKSGVAIMGWDGTNYFRVKTNASGELIIGSSSLPTGAATAANQTTAIGHLATLAAVDFATSAKQDTSNGHLATIAGVDFATQTTLAAMSAKLPASLGAKLSAASFSVVLASDATLPLPTGAATAANQTTAIGHLATLAAVDYATSAKQDTSNGHLATIAGVDFATQTTLAAMSAKLPATLGQKAKAASLAVTLASDEDTLNVKKVGSAAGTAGSVNTGVVATLTAPANATRVKLQNDSENTQNIRIGTAGFDPTTSTGIQLLPGESDWFECTSIRHIAESGTPKLNYFWETV
jgi:hypothetical protein